MAINIGFSQISLSNLWLKPIHFYHNYPQAKAMWQVNFMLQSLAKANNFYHNYPQAKAMWQVNNKF